MVTLAFLAARAVEQVKAEDNAADVIDGGAAGTAEVFRDYLLGQGLVLNTTGGDQVKGSKVFEDACDALRAAYRSQYCNRVRKGVNMVLAKQVLDSTTEQRADWDDDSEQKKIWNKIQGFGRTKLQRVCDVIWPPKKAATKGKGKDKGVSAQDVLETLDAFLKSRPAPALVANLFDQIAIRRPKK